MTHKTTMPEPMLVVDRRVNGYVRFTTAGSLDFPRHPDGTKLITTDQAEAYTEARVREALLEAYRSMQELHMSLMNDATPYVHPARIANFAANRISALIPTTK